MQKVEIKFTKQSASSSFYKGLLLSEEKFLDWYYHDCNKASKLDPPKDEEEEEDCLRVISSKGEKASGIAQHSNVWNILHQF